MARTLRSVMAVTAHRTFEHLPTALLPVETALVRASETTLYPVDPAAIRHVILNERRMVDASGGDWSRGDGRQYRGLWKSGRQHASRWFTGRFVLGGTWDQAAEPFQRHHAYEVIEHIVAGWDWRETAEYRSLLRDVERQDYRYSKGCRSREDVDAYFHALVELVGSVRSSGYRCQAQLGGSPGDEIRVLVGTSGQLIAFGGGTHRLAAAQLLEVPSVGILVKAVHAAWAKRSLDRYGPPMVTAVHQGLRGATSARPT